MEVMNKKAFIEFMAKTHKISKTDATKSLHAVTDSIGKALAKGHKISFIGFGHFRVLEQKARKGRNPNTGMPMNIKAVKRAVFRAGSKLKALFNK